MKQLLAAVCRDWYTEEMVIDTLKAQIDQSLSLGWKHQDIVIIADIGFEYRGICSYIHEFPPFARSNVKTFAAYACFLNLNIKESLWCHDLDAWQISPFDTLVFEKILVDKPISFRVFGGRRERVQGASVFYGPGAQPFLQKAIRKMERRSTAYEEPVLTALKSDYADLIFELPLSYNFNPHDLNCETFEQSWQGMLPPLIVHQPGECDSRYRKLPLTLQELASAAWPTQGFQQLFDLFESRNILAFMKRDTLAFIEHRKRIRLHRNERRNNENSHLFQD